MYDIVSLSPIANQRE